MKPPLIAFLLIATISSCKKEYSYEGAPTLPQKPKQLCNIITDKHLVNDTTGHFMLGDLEYEAELDVSLDVYNNYKLGAEYCNIPTCGYITSKYTSFPHPTITYCDSPTGRRTFSVTLVIPQSDYDKYKVGDLYCY